MTRVQLTVSEWGFIVPALLEGMIAEAAKRGEVDLSLVGIDSTTARAHHDAAGMHHASGADASSG